LEPKGKPEDSENDHGDILLALTLRARRSHGAVVELP